MSMSFLDMPNWKSKILNAVAWILGYRGEHVYCITINMPPAKLHEYAKGIDKVPPQSYNCCMTKRHSKHCTFKRTEVCSCATLSEKDLKAIQEALDRAYQAGYDAGMAANKPYTYPTYPNTNTPPYVVYCQNV